MKISRRRTRVRPRDLWGAALIGATARPLRTVLSAIGIAVGIAALVAISGIAASNRAQFLAELDGAGANLLTVAPNEEALPAQSPEMIGRIGPVEAVGTVYGAPKGVKVYRNDLVPARNSGGIKVFGADRDLLTALDARMTSGVWFSEATEALPTVVLGARAAITLGISEPGQRVWLGGSWHQVLGILSSVELAPGVDDSVFVGHKWLQETLWPERAAVGETGAGEITMIYLRTTPAAVGAVRNVLAATANPARPEKVAVSKLSDFADARAQADDSLGTLALGLGGIALLVGGIGVANTMVVAVIERRGEIGLRRALGARRRDVAGQFIAEAMLLSLIGGLIGVALGILGTGVYSALTGQLFRLDPLTLLAAPVLALGVGALAGMLPAWRASGLTPAEALRGV